MGCMRVDVVDGVDGVDGGMTLAYMNVSYECSYNVTNDGYINVFIFIYVTNKPTAIRICGITVLL